MSQSFVDHLQLLPMPARRGVRQPDGDHRPGGLGLRTLGDRLGVGGWTARLEDFGFEKPVPERRITEAYARAIGDAVRSAWDRTRFPVVLSLVNTCGTGVIDGFGPSTGVVWVSPRAEYRTRSLLRRAEIEHTTLATMTGRQEREKLAAEPQRVPARHVIVVGGQQISAGEATALAEDGVRIIGPESVDDLGAAVDAVDADGWYVHIDACALDGDAMPAADESVEGGFAPAEIGAALEAALEGKPIRCIALTRYDLNRDVDGRSVETLASLLDRLLMVAGGEPNPEAREAARAS